MCGCNKAKKTANPSPQPTRRSRAIFVPSNVLPIVDTPLWGPHLWKALHVAAQFTGDPAPWSCILSAMTTGLPCPDCSAHYNTWYRNIHPPPAPPAPPAPAANRGYGKFPFMANRTVRKPQTQTQPQPKPLTLTQPIPIILLDLHNEVNQRIGKPVFSVEQLYATYGGDKESQKTAAIHALQILTGVIGAELYTTLLALLQSL